MIGADRALRTLRAQLLHSPSRRPGLDRGQPGRHHNGQCRAVRTRPQRSPRLQERQRLARNLHDAVNQSLFSAGLIAEVLPRLWERDPD
jgi:signal transduction histidine kinase